jgi:hypothetical protein
VGKEESGSKSRTAGSNSRVGSRAMMIQNVGGSGVRTSSSRSPAEGCTSRATAQEANKSRGQRWVVIEHSGIDSFGQMADN